MAIEEQIEVSVAGLGSVDALAGALDKAAGSAAKLRESMAGGGSKSGAASMARSMDAAATKMAGAIDKMDASFAKLKASGAEASAAMGDIGKAGAGSAAGLGDAAKGANDAAAAYGRLGKASRDSAAMMDEQAVAGSRAGKSSAEAAAGGTKFWGGLKTVMIGTGIAAAYGIDKAMKFQGQMLLLHTQAGVSTKDTQAMSKGALLISTQTGQALGDVAESAYHVASNMASMGTSVPKMLLATKTAAEGAAVGHANMVDVTNALTAAIASGIPGVKNYNQAMGMLNATVGSGDMSMQDLSEAFGTGMVASVKGYGLSLKDTGAALAVFGDNNIRGAKAGTDLRMAVQSLAVQGPSAAGELKKLGLGSKTLANDMQSGGLLKALDDLNGKFKAHGITAKNEGQVLTDLFGKKAGVGLSLLMGQMDRLKSKYPDITAGANNFGKAWAATQASPAQKWKELTAGLQANVTGFGTELLPAFTKAAGFADHLLADINGSKNGAKDMALAFGGIAALFTAKKLTSGVESAVKTAEAGLRVTGKVAQVLKIPGLSGLSNIGKSAGLDGAAASLDGSAGALKGAAASLEGAAGKLAGEGALGSTAGKAGGAAAGAEGAAAGAAGAEGAAAGAAEGEAAAGGASRFKGPAMTAGVGALAALTIVDPVLKSMKSGPGGKNWFENPFGMAGPHDKGSSGNWLTSFSPYERLFRQTAAPAAPAAIPAGAAPAAYSRFGASAGGAPAKVAVDTSGVSAARGQVQGAVGGIDQILKGFHPAKIPAPDTSALNSAKGKAQSAANGITQAIESAMKKPAKLPPPDLSAATAAAGKARAAGANMSAGLASGIESGKGAAVAAAADVANAAAAAMNKAIEAHSPSKKTEKTGKDFDQGFVIGLQGGQDAVSAAAAAVGKTAAKAADIASIDSYTKKLLGQVPKGDTALTAMLKADNKALDNMARQRARLESEISDSEQVATNVIGGASVMNSLNAVNPAGNEPIAASAVITGQQYQASSLKQFAQQIAKLQKMGLNATGLSQIAQAGPDQGLGIAQAITSGGPAAIRQLNQLQKQIHASAAQIGNVGGVAMYQSGKDIAAGLADGLKADLAGIDKAMAKLAQSMVASVSRHAKAAKGKAAAAAGGAAGSGGVSGSSSGGDADTHAAAPLSAAGAALSGAAAALSSAAAALHKDATAGTVHAHPVASAARSGAHLVAAAAASGGSGGGGTVRNITNVTVQGTVTAERDLLNSLQNLQLKRASNNHQGGWKLPGRGT